MAGPYLFVGAGFSRRYAELPNWRDLLSNFATPTGMPFGYYESGSLPEAASKLAQAFHEVWWRSPDFASSVEEWHDRAAGNVSMPLKIEIANLLDTQVERWNPTPELAPEFELLKSATVDGVITTNYDKLLRKAFPSYRTFVGQEGLLFSDTQGIAEIYAIHGSTSDPASLLLTAEDYKRYETRNAYLAAKLLTIFVEHPVVFLGYSFNDPNIHQTLLSLVRGLQDQAVNKLQDRLIFVEWDPDSTGTVERTQMSIEGQLLPVVRVVVPTWTDVFRALGARKHALPARTLRILKQQVYDIVLTNDPKERLYAYRDIDDESAQDISIVFGVGAKVATVGLVGLSRTDIWNDVLENPAGGYNADDVLALLIPKIPTPTYYPIFRYLRGAGLLGPDGALAVDPRVTDEVKARYNQNLSKITTTISGATKRTVHQLDDEEGWQWILNNALSLPARTDDVEGLRLFLIEHVDKTRVNLWWPTQYAKAIVAYDYMKFAAERAEATAPELASPA